MQVSQDEVNDFLSQWSGNISGDFMYRIVGALLVLFIGFWLIRYVARYIARYLQKSNVDTTVALFLENLIRYSLYAVLLVTALSVLGVPLSSVVAVLGASALAIGLALQDSLKNIASGVLIVLLKPYEVGEFVEINDRTGIVVEVSLYHTQIRTPDNKLLYVPNSNVMSDHIINYSDLEIIRVDMVFGIGYEDDIRKAKAILQEIVDRDERILTEPAPVIAVGELGDSSVNLVVQPFAKRDEALQVRYDTTEQVKLRFDEAGISIPFPQRDVHLIAPAAPVNGNN